MARKFKVNGIEYSHLEIMTDYHSEPITITFTKHDIGTWNAYIEELNTWEQGSTKEEALFYLMVKHFGRQA